MLPRILSWMKVRMALVIIVLSNSSSSFRDATITKKRGVVDSNRKGIEIGTTPAADSFDDDIVKESGDDSIPWERDGKNAAIVNKRTLLFRLLDWLRFWIEQLRGRIVEKMVFSRCSACAFHTCFSRVGNWYVFFFSGKWNADVRFKIDIKVRDKSTRSFLLIESTCTIDNSVWDVRCSGRRIREDIRCWLKVENWHPSSCQF